MGGEPGAGFLGSPPQPPARRYLDPDTKVALPQDLTDRIVAERMKPTADAGDYGRNLAVARVEVSDAKSGRLVKVEFIPAWNLPDRHSEALIMADFNRRAGQARNQQQKMTITHLYTERIPCGPSQADCGWQVREIRERVFFSVKEKLGTRAEDLARHYEPYRRNIPRPPGSGGPGEPSGTKAKTPRAKKAPRRAGKAAAGAVAATLAGVSPEATATPRPTPPPVADRATSRAQRLVDPPDLPGRAFDPGTASRGVPATPRPEPQILRSTPRGAPAPPPVPATSKIAKKGEHAHGGVTLSYDFTDGSRSGSIKMKSVEMADFFRKESRVTRLIKSPALRKLAVASAPTAASLLTGWGMDAIKNHFSAFIKEAWRNFDRAFPSAQERAAEVDLEENKATLDAMVDELGRPTAPTLLKLTPKEVMTTYLYGIFEYERVNLELQERLVAEVGGDLRDIHDDIEGREGVLKRIALHFEEAFVWIHSHIFGALLPVYYASFDLWMLRGLFEGLGNEMGSFRLFISQRRMEYETLVNQLGDDMDAADPWLTYYREFYEENKHLL